MSMNIKNIDAIVGKLPPQALETETAVLGALLLESDAFEAISSIIDVDSFYKQEHQTIFKAIKDLHKNNKPVDLIIITQELQKQNKLDEVGGPLYITQLTSKVASAAHIEHHARIITEKYIQREVIRSCTEIQSKAYNNEDVELLQTELSLALEHIDNAFSVADIGKRINDVAKETIIEIEESNSKAEQGLMPGIPTGFTRLDTNTGGWRNGNMIVLAARPGVGKTSLALHFLKSAAKAGYWVNFFSLEMRRTELFKILLAGESGIYRSNIRDGQLNAQEWKKLNEAIGDLENLPILFKDAAGMNVNQIKNIIHQNRKKEMCDIAIIDYMQLVKSSQPKAIRELEVSEISRTLKTTALNENIPIIALSQLSRVADTERPKLSHLRESGAIEQDADMVCFLTKSENKILFDIAKHRNGRLGDMEITPLQEMTRFRECEQYYPSPNEYTETDNIHDPY